MSTASRRALVTSFERAAALRAALEVEQTRLLQRLYEDISRSRGWGAFDELTKEQRDSVLSRALLMCEQWEKDAALRDSYVAGSHPTVDLIALHFQIVQQLEAADTVFAAAIGAFGQTRR